MTDARTTRLLAPRCCRMAVSVEVLATTFGMATAAAAAWSPGDAAGEGNDARGGCRGDAAATVMSQT